MNGYEEMLQEFGLTDSDVWKIMESLPAPTPCKHQDSAFEVIESPIHGLGMFAKRKIVFGEVFVACFGTVRYNLARYANHSDEPNAVLNFTGNLGVVMVTKDIQEGEELTMDYAYNLRKIITPISSLASSC
jgi:SET domain-containing protein